MIKENLYIGIDIGGTNTVIGAIDEQNNHRTQLSFNTEAGKPFTGFMDQLQRAVKRLFEKNGNAIKGIGIGVPGANHATGLIEAPHNFAWGKINMVSDISRKFHLPVKIINDADAAALGEMHFGCARDLQNFVHITIGTGVGAALIADGKILSGHSGLAGEFGHTHFSGSNRQCTCGKKGCLETYVSANGLRRNAMEILSNETTHTALRGKSFNALTGEIITGLAAEGDEAAMRVFQMAGQRLGKQLANLVALINPQAIIFSGGVCAAGSLLFKPAREALEKNLLPMHRESVEFRFSDSQKNYAVLGAAALIRNELFNVKQKIGQN